ncbi:MAG: hypothetical protein AAGI63_09625 [Planctomycetota bacterium]
MIRKILAFVLLIASAVCAFEGVSRYNQCDDFLQREYRLGS